MSLRPKNILIVAHHYPPHITGVGFVAQNQAKRLSAAGECVTVISSKTTAAEKSRIEDGVNVITVYAWNITEMWGAPFPIFSPAIIPVLFTYIRKADIVHIHDAFYMSSFFAALIAKFYKKPIVLTQHVSMITHPSKLIVLIQKAVYATTGTMIFRASNAIFTFNDRVEAFLIRQGVPENKIVRLPNGVDTQLFHPIEEAGEKKTIRSRFGIDQDKKIVLFVGRFVPKKGFDKVLASRSHDYQIVCAGGDPPKEKIDNVIFLGKLDQNALAEVYRAADIFVLPSESEGFPLSVQEAMACGLPIITSEDEGYKQYDLDRERVFLIDSTDYASVRTAIRSVIDNDAQLKKMGSYSVQYANAHFAWSSIISKLEKTYDDAIFKKI